MEKNNVQYSELKEQIEQIHSAISEVKTLLLQTQPKELVTAKEACKLLKIGYNTLVGLLESGQLVYANSPGKRKYFLKNEVLQLLDSGKDRL